jgi:rhodanese-related sulfurtransferase
MRRDLPDSRSQPILVDLNLPCPDLPDEASAGHSPIDRSASCPTTFEAFSDRGLTFQLPVLPYSLGKFPLIAPRTLAQLLTEPGASPFARLRVVDARSATEYAKGHIESAHNAQTAAQLAALLPLAGGPGNVGVVIHCEYTSRRAPALAQEFRGQDRQFHKADDSPLSYPELYLLEGGYCAFYAQHRGLCTGSYLKEEAAHARRARSAGTLTPPDPFDRLPAIRMERSPLARPPAKPGPGTE